VDSDDVEKKVLQSGSDLVELHGAMKQLQSRVDRLVLIVQVLKEMLLAQGGFSEDQFLEQLQRAAAQKAESKNCHKCGKVMSPRQNRCIYCGEMRPTELI
jgi:hypothetical protein